MAEDNLWILQQKVNNLIKKESQTFVDALESSNSKDAKRGFPYLRNTREKAQMSSGRIHNLSTGMISILWELSDKGVFVIDSENKIIIIDTVVTPLFKEVESMKEHLRMKRGFDNMDCHKRSFAANARMVDIAFEDSKNMIVTEIEIIMRAVNPLPPIIHNNLIANSGVHEVDSRSEKGKALKKIQTNKHPGTINTKGKKSSGATGRHGVIQQMLLDACGAYIEEYPKESTAFRTIMFFVSNKLKIPAKKRPDWLKKVSDVDKDAKKLELCLWMEGITPKTWKYVSNEYYKL